MSWRAVRKVFVRLLAPAAFLAAVTVAVTIVRDGLRAETDAKRPAAAKPASTERLARVQRPVRKRYYVIKEGDTLDVVALRYDTTVLRLLRLNPGVRPTALQPGQKIRVA